MSATALVAILALAYGVAEAEPAAPALQPAVRITPPIQVTTPDGPPTALCPQWWSEARDAGWAERDLNRMDRVMWCESRCDPHAANRSGARGLMQLMPVWWQGIGDPFNPLFNLSRALHVLAVQGWKAWSCA
jgi:hypothetical protein